MVCAYSYENFENVFDDFFRVYHRTEVGRLQSDLAATSAPTIKKQIESKLQCARCMQKMFWHSGRRLRLAGIQTSDGSVVSCPKLVQKELVAHWGSIYEKKTIDRTAAKTLLGLYSRRHKDLIEDFRSHVLPDRQVFCNINKRVQDSACGPDGIHYSAYAVFIENSCIISENTFEYFSSAEEVFDLDKFTMQFVWFPPKANLGRTPLP